MLAIGAIAVLSASLHGLDEGLIYSGRKMREPGLSVVGNNAKLYNYREEREPDDGDAVVLYQGRKVIRKVPGVAIKAVPLPTPEVSQGFGVRQQVGRICEEAGYRSVLVVTGKRISSLDLHEKVLASLRERDIPFTVFNEVGSWPT